MYIYIDKHYIKYKWDNVCFISRMAYSVVDSLWSD